MAGELPGTGSNDFGSEHRNPDLALVVPYGGIVAPGHRVSDAAGAVGPTAGEGSGLVGYEGWDGQLMAELYSLAVVRQNGQEVVLDSPPLKAVVSAARAGQRQSIVITREGVGQPSKVVASGSLLPLHRQDSLVEDHQVAETGQTKFTAWTRFTITPAPTASTDGESSPEPSATDGLQMTLANFLSQYTGSYQLAIQADPVDPATVTKLRLNVSDALRTASQTDGLTHLVGQLEAYQRMLDSSAALVHRSVVVGAEDVDQLHRLAAAMRAYGFTSDKHVIDVATSDGRLEVHDSMASALEAASRSQYGYVGAEYFANEVHYPHSIPGVGTHPYETFAASRRIEKGLRAVTVAELVDNDGRPAGELKVSLQDLARHTAFIGSSGSGKTTLVHKFVTEILAEQIRHAQATQEAPSGNEVGANGEGLRLGAPIVIVDFEKTGNYAEQLSKLSAGLGLDIPVNCITPGSDELRANINPLRMTGTTPHEQIEMSLQLLSARLKDPLSKEVFERYAGEALELAFAKLGWNMSMNDSAYEGRTPPTPDMDMVRIAIEEVMASTRFQDELKGNIGQYSEQVVRDALRGIPGQLFQGGYDIDWTSLIKSQGVTVIQLGKIKDETARRMALNAIYRGLYAALEADKPSGSGDVDETKLWFIQDETGGIYDGVEGEKNAQFFKTVRGLGMSIMIAQQSGIDRIHRDVLGNIANIFAFQLNDPRDVDFVAERARMEPPRLLSYIKRGNGLYLGLDMPDGPDRFTVPHPESMPRGDGQVRNRPESILNRGTHPEFYPDRTNDRAKELLLKTELGNRIRGVAGINAFLFATRRDPGEVDDNLLESLREMSGEVRSSAIYQAVTKAVYARPQLMHVMDSQVAIDYLAQDLLAQVAGMPRPPRPDVYLNVGKFSPAEDRVVDAMTADPIRKPEFAFLGEIAGRSADEQVKVLDNKENESLKQLIDGLSSAEPLSAESRRELAVEMQKLLGRGHTLNDRQRLWQRIEERLGQVLNESQRSLLAALEDDRWTYDLADMPGYADLRSALLQAIVEAEEHPAVDLSDLEEEYGIRFGDGKAKDQLAVIRQAKKADLERQPYSANMSDLIFAPDLMKGGHELDNVVAYFVGAQKPQGSIHDRQQRDYGNGQLTSYSIVDALRRGDMASVVQWAQQVGIQFLSSRYLKLSHGSRAALMELVSGELKQLLATHAAQRQSQQSSSPAVVGVGG